MTNLNVGIRMHVEPEFLDADHGPCATLDRHVDALVIGEFDGVGSDGRRCQALTLDDRDRCPKDGAVAVIVNGGFVHLCGTHFGVHRRGKRLVEVVLA